MPAKLVITKSCLIESNKVVLNGEVVFDNPNLDTAGFLMSCYKHSAINYPKFYKMDKLCKLGFLAAEQLLNAQDVMSGYQKDEIAIILYNANASLDADMQYYDSVSDLASPALFVYTLPNILIGELCIRHGIKGESSFFLEEKFNADSLIDYVSLLLEQDLAKACLCGWVDVLVEEYKACMMWVEKDREGKQFTTETIHSIYNQLHG